MCKENAFICPNICIEREIFIPLHRKLNKIILFINLKHADSLDTVELIMEFEKEFGISIPDDQAEKIQTVGDAISYIEANAK